MNNNIDTRTDNFNLAAYDASIDPVDFKIVEDQMAIAYKIGLAMEAKGLTKTQFARQIGQPASVISKWLTGQQNFTIETLTRIGFVLGISLLDCSIPKHLQINAPLEYDTSEDNFDLMSEDIVFDQHTTITVAI